MIGNFFISNNAQGVIDWIFYWGGEDVIIASEKRSAFADYLTEIAANLLVFIYFFYNKSISNANILLIPINHCKGLKSICRF